MAEHLDKSYLMETIKEPRAKGAVENFFFFFWFRDKQKKNTKSLTEALPLPRKENKGSILALPLNQPS